MTGHSRRRDRAEHRPSQRPSPGRRPQCPQILQRLRTTGWPGRGAVGAVEADVQTERTAASR
eukprot:8752113-Pyramimonas_sp.AAC.1